MDFKYKPTDEIPTDEERKRCPLNICDGEGYISGKRGRYKYVYDCPCFKHKASKREFEGLVGLSQTSLENSFDTVKVRNSSIRGALETFAEHGHNSYYAFGSMGTGKTRLLEGSIVAACKMRIPCAFMSVPRLLTLVSYRDQEANAIWEQAIRIPYLVLDDIGRETPNRLQRERLFLLIDERYKLWQKGVAHTSFSSLRQLNKRDDGSGLENIIDMDMVSRIRQMCYTIHIEGEDYRRQITPEGNSERN